MPAARAEPNSCRCARAKRRQLVGSAGSAEVGVHERTPVHELSPSLFLLRDTCNVYVVRAGARAMLIDFGSGRILDELPAMGIDSATDLLVTHHHRDQVQGLVRAV